MHRTPEYFGILNTCTRVNIYDHPLERLYINYRGVNNVVTNVSRTHANTLLVRTIHDTQSRRLEIAVSGPTDANKYGRGRLTQTSST